MDRNSAYLGDMPLDELSLSARRAWIEMLSRDADGAYLVVALRKESVDRNPYLTNYHFSGVVALRKESVDRNMRTTLIFLLSP